MTKRLKLLLELERAQQLAWHFLITNGKNREKYYREQINYLEKNLGKITKKAVEKIK